MNNELNESSENNEFFDKSIYLRLAFKSHCVHCQAENYNKCLYTAIFDKIVKLITIILKTEQVTIVYAQWDRWASYEVIKHHMITTDVIIKITLKTMRNSLC